MVKVIRVFGRADSYDIEFTPKGDKWVVDIPPDMTDGVYACQLTAIDSNGESAYWVGELYMVDGVCCLKINEVPYKVRLQKKKFDVEYTDDFNISFCKSLFNTDYKDRYDTSYRSSLFNVAYQDGYDVQFRKVSEANYITDFAEDLKASVTATHSILTTEAKQTETKPKTESNTEFRTRTEIFIRKGCQCYGNKNHF